MLWLGPASKGKPWPMRSFELRWGHLPNFVWPGSSRRSHIASHLVWRALIGVLRTSTRRRSGTSFPTQMRSSMPSFRSQPPNKIEDFEARARRQNEVWTLVYEAEWKPVRSHALDLLLEWHQAEPHKWPLTVMAEIWEELRWRFLEELKEILRQLKKEANRETMSLPDIKFYALLPNAAGQAWLELPRTFDLKNPNGWFMSEVLPSIERRQARMLWSLTWEGSTSSKPQGSTHAGGDHTERGERPNLKSLWGPKLSTVEVNAAKDRAPVDKDGVLLCWGHLTHMGCANQSCQRSHAALQGKFEALDPCVQMQLFRRDGLRRAKAATRETVTDKIKALRTQVAKDKATKIADGARKSGESVPTEASETRAGGDKNAHLGRPRGV